MRALGHGIIHSMNTAKIIKTIVVVVVLIAAILFIWSKIKGPKPAERQIEVPSERDKLTEAVQAAPSTVDNETRARLEAQVKAVSNTNKSDAR